jgi:hypothetical protein
LDAKATLTISNDSNESARAVSAVLYHKLEVTAICISGGRSLPFTQQVLPLPDFQKMLVRYVQITLDDPLPAKATLSVEIRYHGSLAGYVETGTRYVKDRVGSDFTIIRPDCLAYPVISQPSLAALNAAAIRDARQGWDYVLDVTVPEPLVVANGGRLLGTRRVNGQITWSYTNARPAWRIDACIARYRVLENEGASLKVFFLLDHEAGARRALDALERSVELLSQWLGPLPASDSFVLIQLPSGYGSQTDHTCILEENEAFQGELHNLYHEASHRWNPPPIEPAPCRLETEGTATLFEYLLTERLEGKTGSLLKAMLACRKEFCNQCQRNPRLKDLPIAEYGTQNCTDASYTKGAVACWVLYRLVGERAFLDACRSLYQTHGKQGATLDDFMTAMRTASGQDLRKFSDEWIRGARSSEHLLSDISLEEIFNLYDSRPARVRRDGPSTGRKSVSP